MHEATLAIRTCRWCRITTAWSGRGKPRRSRMALGILNVATVLYPSIPVVASYLLLAVDAAGICPAAET